MLHGKLPAADSYEIALPSFIYDYFKISGYRDRETGKTVEINDYDDIIGKKMNIGLSYKDKDEYIISGVVDLGLDYSRYLELADPKAENSINPLTYMSLISELEAMRDYSYATLLFVNQSIIDELVSNAANSAETVNGSVQLMLVKDPSAEYLWDEGNVLSSVYVSSLNYLEKLDNVKWFDGVEKKALADNEIIVSFSSLIDMICSQSYDAMLYESSVLVGFERDLYNKSQDGGGFFYVNTLNDILNSLKFYTGYKYAVENQSDAVTYYKSWEKSYHGGSIHDSKYYTSDEFLMDFANAYAYNDLKFTGSESLVDNYIDELISKYKIGRYFISKEVAETLVSKMTVDKEMYVSYDVSSLRYLQNFKYNYNDVLARKYAFDNYSEAKDFFSYTHSKYDYGYGYQPDVDEIISFYVNCFINDYDYVDANTKEKIEAYKAKYGGAEKYDDYMSDIIVNLYKSTQKDGTLVIQWYSNVGGNGMSDALSIVGIYKSVQKNGNFIYDSYSSFFVLSDNFINKILGANRGGIYSFAIGNMPEGQNKISDVVDFSYELFDDNYRFSLMNNVTEQLSMVDELLNMLGQIFLYVGIGFAVFASLMLSNFIGTSISYKKHDIGILRAIGSRSADVFKIFFAESFIIAMINYVLSAAGTLTVTIFINKILREDAGLLITFLNFGIRQIAVLLLVSVAVAFIATFLPVKKIASMKPIDAIKNRK